MNILLDECVPWPLHKLLPGHHCATAQHCGWGGMKNGHLIAASEQEFDLFITSDQNLRYQKNLASRTIAILELSTNNWRRIRSAASTIQSTITSITPGLFVHLDIP